MTKNHFFSGNKSGGTNPSQGDSQESRIKKLFGKVKSLSDIHSGSLNPGSQPEKIEERFETCLWITIKDLVTREPVVVYENSSLEEILRVFEKHPYHTFPVIDNKNELVGVIDLDIILEILLLCLIPQEKYTPLTAVRSLGETAKDIMNSHPITISLNSTLKDTLDLMMKHRFDRVCVTQNGKLIGIVSKRDLVEEICRRRKRERQAEEEMSIK